MVSLALPQKCTARNQNNTYLWFAQFNDMGMASDPILLQVTLQTEDSDYDPYFIYEGCLWTHNVVLSLIL